MVNKNYSFLKYFIIIIFLLFLLSIIILFYHEYVSKEYFDNGTNNINEESIKKNINYENGIGNKESNGTIKFTKIFDKIPNVYTQPINDNDDSAIIININNITKEGFSYKKYKVNNVKQDIYSVTNMTKSDSENFIWTAIE